MQRCQRDVSIICKSAQFQWAFPRWGEFFKRWGCPTKKTLHASESETPEVWEKFADYAEAVSTVPADKLVFIDETRLYLYMSLLYGWAPRGKRLLKPTSVKKRKHYSLIGALTITGMLTEMVFEGWLDKPAFLVFVREFLVPNLKSDHVVVLDNFIVHKDDEALSLIEETGAEVLFLPPYSPELDPIENGWSKIKHFIRKVIPTNFDELCSAISDSIASITPQDCLGWFRHCGYSDA